MLSNRGQAMIDFIETLRVPEGMHQGSSLVLRPWQRDKIKAVYDPVQLESCEHGMDCGKCAAKGTLCLRIVRKAIFSVAKKNGKTPLVSGLALGHLVGPEAKSNEQIFSGAFDRDQSGIVFRYMSQMVYMDEELSDLLVIRESKKEIYSKENGSVFKALSSEIKGKHGLGPAVLIMDELAQFGADRTFYDTLIQGRGAHAEPILWIISTQAADDLAVLSQEIDYGLKVESGEIHDPTVRCFLFSIPMDNENIHDPEVWALANPALGDFLNAADMEEAARTAKNMPSAEANFRNLRLNQRIDGAAHFISPSIWKACGGEVDLGTFEDRECHGGLDLSAKNDLTALVFEAENDDGVHDVLCYFWTPEDGLRERERRDKAPYCLWRDQGFLDAKPGKTIDYGWVARKIGKLNGILRIAWIRFDRWRIADLQRELIDAGVDCWIEGIDWSPDSKDPMPDGLRLIPHGQGFKDMNPVVEITEDLLVEQRIRHGNHPVLTYCASNVRIQKDPAGNRKFDKLKSTGRIDGLVALGMALAGSSKPKTDDIIPGIIDWSTFQGASA
jgi:phage terminase large subunit-like protein